MLQCRWFDTSRVSRKEFSIVFILLFNAFSWYYMTILVIDNFLKVFNLSSAETLIIWVTYYMSLIVSSVFGSFMSNVRRLRFLYVWMSLGAISSLLPAISYVPPYVWSFALGSSLGVGLPVCLAFFADNSTIENRARLSGTIFLTFSLSAALLALAFNMVDLVTGSVVFAMWRVAGLLICLLLKPKEKINLEKRKQISFVQVLKDRPLRLYLFPWIAFLLIDRSTWLVFGSYYLRNLSPLLSSAAVIGPVIGSFAAFLGGCLSDQVGRKSVVISGFVALGFAYAVIGIAPTMFISWCIYIVVDGIALGILLTTFLLILWGDLSQTGGREKYYVIGVIPYFSTSIMESVLNSYVAEIPAYAAFSLASFFLFIAVLPLLYAPETLPEKRIEIRRLKGYIEQARKIREKHAPS